MTRTPKPSKTPKPTRTPKPTATLTPTPSRYTIYLPFLHWEKQICVPESVFTDVVLVLDMSTSMYRPTRENGRSKHLAAIDAARAFLSLLSWADGAKLHDQVAVVAFNDTAWTEMGLSSDHGEAMAALERLPARIAQGTRLDLALDQARESLRSGPRLGSNRPTVILLTDGVNNAGTVHPLDAAQIALEMGVRVYTIGVGTRGKALSPVAIYPNGQYKYDMVDVEIDDAMLEKVAGTTGGKYFRATNERALADIVGHDHRQLAIILDIDIDRRNVGMVRPSGDPDADLGARLLDRGEAPVQVVQQRDAVWVAGRPQVIACEPVRDPVGGE